MKTLEVLELLSFPPESVLSIEFKSIFHLSSDSFENHFASKTLLLHSISQEKNGNNNRRLDPSSFSPVDLFSRS